MPVIVGRKQVGVIEGEVYYTERKTNQFMRMFLGFGISQAVLDKIKDKVKFIIIHYKGTYKKETYKCSIEQFVNSKKGYIFEDKHNRFKIEPELQLFVSVADMQTIN